MNRLMLLALLITAPAYVYFPNVDKDHDTYTTAQGDCNDRDATIYPGNPEVCDQKDNDCNGIPDDGAGTMYYYDGDEDGYGTNVDSVLFCYQPDGYITTGGDCDDTDPTVYPGNGCPETLDDNVAWD